MKLLKKGQQVKVRSWGILTIVERWRERDSVGIAGRAYTGIGSEDSFQQNGYISFSEDEIIEVL